MSASLCGFSAILKVSDKYFIIHSFDKEMTVVSNHPEVDLKTAKFVAKIFSQINKIHFKKELFVLSLPAITVLHHEKEWFPAIIAQDGFKVVKKLKFESLGANLQCTMTKAKNLAIAKEIPFIPSLGIVLHTGKNLPKTHLKLEGEDITDTRLHEMILNSPSLRFLAIFKCPITNEGVKLLQGLRDLEGVIFRSCPSVDIEGLKYLNNPSMKYLEVRNCPLITDNNLDTLMGTLTGLKQLTSDNYYDFI